MKLTEEKLKELLQQSARSTARQAECLTEEQFRRVLEGELNSQERAGVASHLIACSDCTEEYRLLRSLRSWAQEAEHVLAASAQPALPGIGPKRRHAEKAGAQRLALWQRLAPVFSPARIAFALLALLFLSLGGWLVLLRQENREQLALLQQQLAERDQALASARQSVQSLDDARKQLEETIRRSATEKRAGTSKQYEAEIARLRRSVSELSRPQLDAPIVDLDPGGSTRGDPKGSTAKIEMVQSANLILNFSGAQLHSRYEVEVLDERGRQIWRGQQPRKSQVSSVNVTLSRHFVPAGRYLIKLYGLRDGKRELIGDYAVQIEHSQ